MLWFKWVVLKANSHRILNEALQVWT